LSWKWNEAPEERLPGGSNRQGVIVLRFFRPVRSVQRRPRWSVFAPVPGSPPSLGDGNLNRSMNKQFPTNRFNAVYYNKTMNLEVL
jgi:hypothetical protein